MPSRLLTADEFAAEFREAGAAKPPGLVYRLAATDPANIDRQAGRVIPYILSTGAVARDGHTIAPAGWQLGNFRANPIFLWAHASSEPPIGKLTDVSVANGALRGVVEYADAETYPFADTIFRLVKGGFLTAVSVSWDPIRWSFSTDRSRPGGIDFLEQELREVSQVPVPADVTAMATARAAGIDTGPLYHWAGRLLDSGQLAPLARAQLEQLRQNARTVRQAARAPSVYDFAKKDTLFDRYRLARFIAYDNAARLGIPVPACHLPARDSVERAAIVEGLRKGAA
jgi:HK97 family phage prohead protease